MERPRPVKRIEIILFPIVVTLVVSLIVPSATPLVGFLMLGNLFNVSGVTERLSKTVQNELINIVTIMLGVTVGGTASAENFLSFETLSILFLGLAAFCLSTIGGVLLGKLMCFITPVSYTHLDVYKRQDTDSFAGDQRWYRRCNSAAFLTVLGKKRP